MRISPLRVLAVTAVVVGGSYAVPRLSRSDPAEAQATIVAPVPVAAVLAETDRLIATYDAQVRSTPTSSALDRLAHLHLTRARMTGDAASYARARSSVDRSLRIAPKNAEARSLLASILYTTHEFSKARSLARELAADTPVQLDARVVLADASAELGDYDTAARTLNALVRDVPDSAAVLVRQSRQAFLRGDVARARDLSRRALRSAGASGEAGSSLAFYYSFDAQLSFDTGRYQEAVRSSGEALRIAPGDRVATASLGRALAAVGRIGDAIGKYEQLVAVYPDPVALAALGDLHTVNGDEKKAADAFATVEAIANLAQLNAQLYNRELALFYANHDRNVRLAVDLARRELSERKDVHGYDTLAWALYKNGDAPAASKAMQAAMRLGTRDASMLYHAGMIASANGDRAGAKRYLSQALAIGPRFDPLQSRVARAQLERLS